MVLNLPWAQKWVLWVLEKSIFLFFANFSLKKLKPFFGKERQSIQSHLNQSLVIGRFLQNGFEAILSSKTSVVIVWKEHFSVFCKFLSDEVETIFWESEAKRSRLFKSRFGRRSFLENGLEGTLNWDTNVISVWKEHFLVFCKLLSDQVEIIFWEIETKRSKLLKSKFGHRQRVRKWCWIYVEPKT